MFQYCEPTNACFFCNHRVSVYVRWTSYFRWKPDGNVHVFALSALSLDVGGEGLSYAHILQIRVTESGRIAEKRKKDVYWVGSQFRRLH
jgi:hypothetical protein